MRSLSVMTAWLIKASRIDCAVPSAFLHRSVKKRTPASNRNLLKPISENSVARRPSHLNFVENGEHLIEKIDRLAVGFSEFDSESVKREHRPLGEPADPDGDGRFIRISDNCFSFRNTFPGDETEFRY